MSRWTTDETLPPEVRWHVSRPDIVLFGCQPYVPAAKGACPTCHGLVADRPDVLGKDRPSVVYCARCDGMSEANEAKLARQRHETSIAERGRDDAERERRDLEHAVEDARDVVLSEAQRREIWYGYKGSPLGTHGREPTSLAKAGREFLRRINQTPDFRLILDRRGKVVGRHPALEFACGGVDA